MNNTAGAKPIDFTLDEQQIISDIFDDWSDASGLTFTEVEDSRDNYGEIRLSKLDFSIWAGLDSVYDDAGASLTTRLAAMGITMSQLVAISF